MKLKWKSYYSDSLVCVEFRQWHMENRRDDTRKTSLILILCYVLNADNVTLGVQKMWQFKCKSYYSDIFVLYSMQKICRLKCSHCWRLKSYYYTWSLIIIILPIFCYVLNVTLITLILSCAPNASNVTLGLKTRWDVQIFNTNGQQ